MTRGERWSRGWSWINSWINSRAIRNDRSIIAASRFVIVTLAQHLHPVRLAVHRGCKSAADRYSKLFHRLVQSLHSHRSVRQSNVHFVHHKQLQKYSDDENVFSRVQHSVSRLFECARLKSSKALPTGVGFPGHWLH